MSLSLDYVSFNHIRAAQGYVELEMAEDAAAELDALSAEHRDMIEVMILRMEILRLSKKWEEGTLLGQRALAKHADCGALYLITAYAMRRHAGLAPGEGTPSFRRSRARGGRDVSFQHRVLRMPAR